jgi:hypothetical protein
MPLLRGGCIMANSIRWSLIEGHGPPRVGSGKWKSRRRQGLGGRGNSEATPEAPPLSSKFGYSLGGSTRVLVRGATPAGPDPPSQADDTGPRCSALQQWRTAHHRPWPSAAPGSGPANPSKTGRNGVGTTGRGQSGVQGTPLIFEQPTRDCVVILTGSTVRPQRQDVCDSPHETEEFVLPYNGCTSGLGGAPAPAGASLGTE